MLHIWTGADIALVRRFTKPVFGSQPHCIVPINETPQIAGDSDVVLALGGKAVDKLVRGKMVPKNRTISSLRGKRISGPKTGCSFLVSFDPALVHRDAKVEEELRWDMRLAQRLHDTGTIRPLLGDYRWVPDLTELIDSIKAKHKKTGKPVTVAMDTETMGLFPWFAAKKIVTSQWTDEEGRAFVLDHRVNGGALTDLQAEQIRWLLSSTVVRLWGANFKYDLQWLWRKWKIGCLNFTFDLVLAGSLLNENRHNSLKALTKSYVPELGGYEEELESVQDKNEMEKTPDDVLLRYAGCDPDATLRSGNAVARELAQDKGLTRFYTKLLHPAARAFERFEDRGIFVNVKAYLGLEKEVKEEVRTLTREIMGMIPLRVRARYSDNLSLTRPVLIRDALFSPEGFGLKPTIFTEKTEDLPPDEQIPSTSLKEHLGQFRAHPEAGPLVQKLEDWQSAKKTASTYIGKRSSDGKRFSKGFLSHLRPDGRFHPSYALHAGALFEDEDNEAGTNTGRLSAKNPAIQTLPKHTKWAKRLRSCYIAPPGYLCWQIDFSQGELRVAACLADEQNMLRAYREGIDLHAKTAASANSIPLDVFLSWEDPAHPQHDTYEVLRQGGKAGNFGLLYAMGARGFMDYAWKSYRVLMTLEQAEAFRNDFFATYPGLLDWHDEYRALAHKQGFIRSPLGRVRHLPLIHSPDRQIRSKAERQAINSPVQGTLSDLNLWGASKIEAEFGSLTEDGKIEGDLLVVGTTHDSMEGYVREAQAETLIRGACAIVAKLPIREVFGWDHQIPFPVDAGIGPDRGHLAKLKLAA